MKYIAILLFLFCGAVNTQAQCPNDECHNASNPAPPAGPYWVYSSNPPQSFQSSCPPSNDPCGGQLCNECKDIMFQWRGCCPLMSVRFQFDGCVRLCGEVVIPTYPAWQSDAVSCMHGPITLKTTNPSDALQTCKWFRVR